MLKHSFKLCVLLALTFALAACSGMSTKDIWQDPKVNLSDVKVAEMDFEKVSLNAILDITNRNKYALAYGAIEYGINVEQHDLFNGLIDQSGSIAAGATNQLSLPLTFKFEDIINLAKTANTDDGIDYTIKGAVLFNVPVIGQLRIPLERSGNMPMLQKPNVSVAGIDIKSMTMSGAELAMKLKVENTNTFDLLLNGFNYALSLNGQSVASGKSAATTAWAAAEAKTIEVPLKVSFADGGMALMNMLSGKGNIDYKLAFDTKVGSSALPFLKSLPFNTVQQGTLNLNR